MKLTIVTRIHPYSTLKSFAFIPLLGCMALVPSSMSAVSLPGSIVSLQQNVGKATGVVKDSDGEPVTGATVSIKGTTRAAVTDVDGRFTLTGVKRGDVIVVSFLGFQPMEFIYKGQELNMTLHPDSQMLDDVVVTAFGMPKQARSVGYATTKVSPDELVRASSMSPVNALQGKVAGVQINTSGASGITSSSSITIRGAKSIDKNNSPIFVIDGMIIQEKLTGNLDGTDWGSQLKNLNPADYESITVLKGAAATALYGSRGANGAVVIVSKGGQYGKKGLGVEINQSVEWTDIYKSPVDLQNVYGAGAPYNGTQGGLMPDGSLTKTAYSWGPRMDGQLLDQYLPNGEKTPFVAHPDNWRDLYQTGVNSITNVAINGGTEKSSFRLSYGFTDNNGVFKRNEFKRHNINFRGLTELNKVFSLEVGVKYGFSKSLNGASQGGWDWGNNVGMLTTYYLPRNYDVKAHEAQYRNPETLAVRNATFGNLSSYLHRRDLQVRERSEQSLLADVTLRANIMPWLKGSLKANYNYYGMNYMQKDYGTGANYGPSGAGYYGRSGSTEGNYNFLGILQSPDNIIKIGGEEISLSAILAGELYGNTASNSWGKGTNGGLGTPGVFAFSNSINKIEPTFDYVPRNMQTFGLYGVLNLGWRDQVFLELTARNDWLSSLTYPKYILPGKNNYSVFYPSANASWVFSDTFRKSLPEWFSFGKLRASLARVGMGTAAYATTKGWGVYKQGSIYLPDKSGSVLSATSNLGTAFNPDLKPEIQQSIELGLDVRFFNERLNVDFAYYKTNTYNQIMSVGGVKEAGVNTQLINAGNIQNSGIELQIEGTPVKTRDWRWTLGGNLTMNRGKIVEFDENVKEWQLMGGYDAAPEIWAYEGGKFGVLTSYQNSGYMSPLLRYEGEKGDARNGKMVIGYAQQYGSPASLPGYYAYSLYDRNEPGDRDRHILGKVEPDFTLSLNTSLSWKNFDLYIQGDGRFGGNYFSNMWKYAAPQGTLKSSLEGRDKEHGGIPRVNYKGETVYDGLMLDAVFADGEKAPTMNPDGTTGPMVDVGGMLYKEAIEKLHIIPANTGLWHMLNYGWGMAAFPESIQDNTWFCLREVTAGYRFPEKICKKFGANYLRLGFTARNICYIINKLSDGLNPASISSNNPLQPMDIGAVPFYRTYSVNLTVRF